MDNASIRGPFRKGFFLVALSIFSYAFLDRGLLLFFGKHPLPLMKIFSFLIYPPLHLILWATTFAFARIKHSCWTIPLFEISASQCVAAAFARIFKVLLGRARPDIFLNKGIFGFYGLEWNHHYHSFPSGHALTAFTLATSLSYIFPRLRILFYALAALLSLTRLSLQDHYLSDVIATGFIGTLIGGLTYTITRRIHYEIIPFTP